MKWVLKEINVGDMVRVPMKDVYHYGVCTGEDRIIQFGEPVLTCPKPKEEIRVIAADISSFLGGQFAEVAELDKKELKKRRSVNEIIEYAESSIGKGGYDILYNNCEHFANECLFGTHISDQIDRVRREIEARMPCINVYVGRVDDFCNTDNLPKYTQKELKTISNQNICNEKKAGYGLLEFAVSKFSEKHDIRKCYLGKTGKPLHKSFCFSISHSADLVAVAVSSAPVGIDLEVYSDKAQDKSFIDKMKHPNETADDAILLWTKKEAAFKQKELQPKFLPAETDTTSFKSKSVTFSFNGKNYALSAVADIVANVHFFSKLPDDSIKFQEIR